MSSQILHMKHSLLKRGFVSKLSSIHWSQLIVLYFLSIMASQVLSVELGPVGTTEVCSGDLWFLGSTSALRGPPPPTLQSSLPSQARLLRPGIPVKQTSSIYISKRHSLL